MAEIELKIKGFRCERCAHEWIPRNKEQNALPVICPKCKSPYWNKIRKRKRKSKENNN